MRLVIHYVGDIHQPLHNSALVSKEYPKGDAGGNAIKITNSKNGVNNLHKLYDSVIYKYTGYVTLPLSESKWNYLKNETNTLTANYPISDDEIKPDDFKAWSDEGFSRAKDIVYVNFNGDEIS